MKKLILLICSLPLVFSWTWSQWTPLDYYVNRQDNTYKYTVLSQCSYEGYTLYNINLTSQTWRTKDDVSNPVWWHYLSIIVPRHLVYTNASFLYLGDGDNLETSLSDQERDPKFLQVMRLAIGAGAVGAYLGMIPNQPITFRSDPAGRARYEDDAIAFTWRAFLEGSADAEFLLRMPMTKAVMRAMDTITDVTRRVIPDSNIDRFMVSGASKRGWTTWTTAAMDKRVFAIAPHVLTCLNMKKNLKHHFRALGGWTWLFSDYYKENLIQYIDHPNFQRMANIIDPYMYRERLTMPKLLISASSDEFFLTDDSHYYFKDLLGPTYLWLVENSGHSITPRSPRVNEIWDDMQAFFISALTNSRMPQLHWIKNETAKDGSMSFWSNRPPKSVVAFEATTTDGVRRDFRRVVGMPPRPNPITWREHEVEYLGFNTYRYKSAKPSVGWKAFFIKATFDGPGGRTLTFTSEANIIPDTLPFPECFGSKCQGHLV